MKTFEEIELTAPLQRALADENYKSPTPIQAKTVPVALQGRDVLGCAQTGTGKTAAFTLPILNRHGQRPRKAIPNRPLALLLAPTRELAIQISQCVSNYGRYLKFRQTLVYGGVSQLNQVRALKRGTHILVATPGRLIDLMEQGHIELDQLETFVLDEVDRMLDMGFLPDLKRIINRLPERRQSLFFSATLPPRIKSLSSRLLRNPVCVDVTPKSAAVNKIEQRVLFVERNEKRSLLRKVLSASDVTRALVFTKTKRGANVLADRLVRDGVTATAIHGNKSQGARQRALLAFRRSRVQVLVATDVAARGIDVDGITHVINFDLPVEPESYVHRIGRTGRAGATGIALSFCSTSERGDLRAIEKLIGMKVPLCVEHTHSDREPPKLGSTSSNPRSTGHRPHKRGTARAVGENRHRRRRRSRRRGQGPNPHQRAANTNH